MLDPREYTDWQIAAEAEKNMPKPYDWQERLGLLPEEIMTMDWLAENVVGTIPQAVELTEEAAPVIKQQGVKKEEG